jgi:subtilisin family serine protease
MKAITTIKSAAVAAVLVAVSVTAFTSPVDASRHTGGRKSFVVLEQRDGRPVFRTVGAAEAARLTRKGVQVAKNAPVKLIASRVATADQDEDSGDMESSSDRHWMVDLIVSGAPVKVAVLDTGIDPHSPMVQRQLIGGEDFTGTTGTHTPWADGNGHGTHVAGIIARHNPTAEILAVKVLDRNGEGDLASVAAGIMWAVENGAEILNLSLGVDAATAESADLLRAAVRHAHAAGAVVVAASGNEGEFGSPASVPAIWEETIAVAATDGNDIASFSNRGRYVDVAAPGVDVHSSALDGGSVGMSGTSMAAPAFAAAVSIVKALRPTWTVRDAANHLMATAADLGARGLDPVFGHGLVNTAVALGTDGPLLPNGKMPTQLKTKVKLVPAVGGATLKVPKGRVFFAKDSEGYITIMEEDTFLPAVKPAVYRIWSYTSKGFPTKPVRLTVRGLNPPRLQISAVREDGIIMVRISNKVPAGSIITLNTYNGRKKTQDAAVLDPNISVVGIRAGAVTHVEVCYSVFAESFGCRKISVPR